MPARPTGVVVDSSSPMPPRPPQSRTDPPAVSASPAASTSSAATSSPASASPASSPHPSASPPVYSMVARPSTATPPAGPPAGPSPFSIYSATAITVHPNQRQNPILQHIRSVAWEFGDIVPDYVIGRTGCALFLSLRYHRLHPEYIYARVKSLRHEYALRILLVLVDVEDHAASLIEISKLSLLNTFTVILAWSVEEAGRYLETFKAYEKKPPDALKGPTKTDYMSQLTDALTSVRSVNKTDVVTLSSTFGSVKRICDATQLELNMCPGVGERKAKRLYEAMHTPFYKKPSAKKQTTLLDSLRPDGASSSNP